MNLATATSWVDVAPILPSRTVGIVSTRNPNRNPEPEPAPGTLNPDPQFGATLTPMLAQAILEKAMLEGMTFRASELTDAFVGGGWVWLAVALALFFIYKRVRR